MVLSIPRARQKCYRHSNTACRILYPHNTEYLEKFGHTYLYTNTSAILRNCYRTPIHSLCQTPPSSSWGQDRKTLRSLCFQSRPFKDQFLFAQTASTLHTPCGPLPANCKALHTSHLQHDVRCCRGPIHRLHNLSASTST